MPLREELVKSFLTRARCQLSKNALRGYLVTFIIWLLLTGHCTASRPCPSFLEESIAASCDRLPTTRAARAKMYNALFQLPSGKAVDLSTWQADRGKLDVATSIRSRSSSCSIPLYFLLV